MRIAIPVFGDRVSPMFDAAKRFVLIDAERTKTAVRRECRIETADAVKKAKHLIASGVNVLICGAISWPLELLLSSAGVRVIPHTCGLMEEVVGAFVDGTLTKTAFLMPGCTGQRRCRHRRGNRLGRDPSPGGKQGEKTCQEETEVARTKWGR